MGFGMAVQSKASAVPVGALSALADELARRGLLTELLGHLADDNRAALTVRITVDRSRRRNASRASTRAH